MDEDGQGCDQEFACVDPAAECVDDDDITIEVAENCEFIEGIGKTKTTSRHENVPSKFIFSIFNPCFVVDSVADLELVKTMAPALVRCRLTDEEQPYRSDCLCP